MVYGVRIVTPHPDGDQWEPFRSIRVDCFDVEDCRATVKRRREAAERRNGTLQWCCSRFQGAPKGTCSWCGEPIVLLDPEDHRRARRARHFGDEYEEGDVDCRVPYYRSRPADPRYLIQVRGDPCCVDCGEEGWEWDADHDVPLWDGGEHCPTNIVRRCVPCHKEKTSAEAKVRAARKRAAA